MDHRLKRVIFSLASFVTLAALACTCGNVGGSPTNPPPTKPPMGGQTPVSGGAIEVSSDVYTHPSGAFRTAYPVGWEYSEREDGTYFGEPNGYASMDVNFTNVGTQLDQDAFTNFVNNIELNWFGSFADYHEESREPLQDGRLSVSRTVTDKDGNGMKGLSFYWQVGTVVYRQDFWVRDQNYDRAYLDGLADVADSIQTDHNAAATQALYAFRYTFQCPSNLCTFNVPYGWTYSRDEQHNYIIIDQFKSPDNLALVENVVYDDGNVINKSMAGQFAPSLLKEFHQVQDIVVTDDEIHGDGSGRLTWYSKSGGYSGHLLFETRGTTFLMLTFAANDAYYDSYSNIWSDIFPAWLLSGFLRH